MPLRIIDGDLLESPDERLIGHQCNCVTIGNAKGLAAALFAKYPFADVYARRKGRDVPGTYSYHIPPIWFNHGTSCAGTNRAPSIVNFYGQVYPGKPRLGDNAEQRLHWLEKGLRELHNSASIPRIALPYGIGCGLAGGHWPDYQDMLEEVCREFPALTIALYRK